MEFVQFHPTALAVEGAPRFLISEAVRGEGAHLIDTQGQRFVFDYHPAGELAPRDVVSRAIFTHLEKTAPDPTTAHVWLDLSPIAPDRIRHRFPNIIQVCQQWGIDVFQEPIPVAPAAHYWMGGIVTDRNSQTTISGLYAVGETASTGVHGANRLASNSLLECLVFGSQLAHLSPLLQGDRWPPLLAETSAPPLALPDSEFDTYRRELPRLMWQRAGISRNQASLEWAIATVDIWRQTFRSLPLTQTLLEALQNPVSLSQDIDLPDVDRQLRAWGETRNLLDVAILMLKSAAFRTESRGGHYRSDYPQTDANWQVHTLVQQDKWSRSPLQS
jgi:L-aspartate oxidase